MTYFETLRAHLIGCNGDYIGIGIRIGITWNIRCCNILLITIHLFDDKKLEDNGIKVL